MNRLFIFNRFSFIDIQDNQGNGDHSLSKPEFMKKFVDILNQSEKHRGKQIL